MNLLVTNTRNAQAYAIIRALRPFAKKIVATMEGENRIAARLSHAANSRLVDKRYYTPSPAADWRAGRIQRENTESEEAYIKAIVGICERENIDTIFPSFDPHVYVFSKNKERFERLGVLLPVPDYETVITPLDKYRTIEAARRVGFPCPKTFLPENHEDIRRIAIELGFPLVIKPRFTAAGRGTAVVRDMPELLEKIRSVCETQGMPLMQEYIPGNQQENIHVVVDRSGEAKLLFHKKFHRLFCNGSFTVYRESVPPNPCGIHSGRFLKDLGWWGAGMVEMKIDDRDNIPKLMEINPRFGSGILDVVQLGMNAPWMCLKIARGEEVEAAKDYPVAVYLHPVEDALIFGLRLLNLLIFKVSAVTQRKMSFDSFNTPTSFNELVRPYQRAYLTGKKIKLDPRMKYFFRDPLVLVFVWLQYLTSLLRAVTAPRKINIPEFIQPASTRAAK